MKLGFCAICGTTEGLHHHHVVPRSMGGSNRQRDNILTLCHKHHGILHGVMKGFKDIGSLTKKGLKDKKAKGERWCRASFGWTFKDGRAVKDKKEQAVLKRIFKLREQGLTYQAIADQLTALGIPTKESGKPWNKSVIWYIIKAKKKPPWNNQGSLMG